MKFTLISFLCLFSTLSFASLIPRDFPEKIVCKSKAKSEAAQQFVISSLNTESPSSNIPDTSLLELDQNDTYLTTVSFSNECDNYYGITFYSLDLLALQEGKIQSVNGLLNYFDVIIAEAEPEAEYSSETVPVTCTLVK